MEQISLENKVNNTLKWLANKIASIQVYHWDEEYNKICDELEDKLCVGRCGWCV